MKAKAISFGGNRVFEELYELAEKAGSARVFYNTGDVVTLTEVKDPEKGDEERGRKFYINDHDANGSRICLREHDCAFLAGGNWEIMEEE